MEHGARRRWPSVFDIHFPRVPGHIGWRLANDHAALLVLFVERVNVFHENRYPGALRPLSALREENLDLALGDAAKVGGSSAVHLMVDPAC